MERNMKKLILGSILGLSSLSAMADGIPTAITYNDGTYATAFPIVQLNFDYQSSSVVTDENGNGVLDAGDTIASVGGARAYSADAIIDVADFNAPALFGTKAINWNNVTGSTPGGSFPASYGLAADSTFAFGVSLDKFTGKYNTVTGEFDYSYGEVSLHLLTKDAGDLAWDTSVNLHTYGIYGTQDYVGGTYYKAKVIDVQNDYFYETLSGESFGSNLGMDRPVFASIFQNRFGSTAAIEGLKVNGFGGQTDYDLGLTNHDGSILYAVPEPTSIAMLGLGLLGLAGASRRRQAK
jgi:hypothetical protein